MVFNKSTLTVTLSGAAGQIAYSLIPFIISGDVFGKDTKIIFRLFDIPSQMTVLEGVKLEIEDSISFNVTEVICTCNDTEAYKDSDYIILVGGIPRRQGMSRYDLLNKNKPIFVRAGKVISTCAPNARILIVANPANTNALVLLKNSSIPARNITVLTRLDQNRASGLVARDFNVTVDSVGGIYVWGNHSSTQVADISNLTVNGVKIDREKRINTVSSDLTKVVAERGTKVIEKRKASSAMSAAKAIRDHLYDWHFGTKGGLVSMGVISDNNPYGIAEGLFFSFPVEISVKGEWLFSKNVGIPDSKGGNDLMKRIKNSEESLIEERNNAIDN